jgi:hypothetical protein
MVLLQKFLNTDTLLYPQEPMATYYLLKHHHSHLSISTGGGQIVAT